MLATLHLLNRVLRSILHTHIYTLLRGESFKNLARNRMNVYCYGDHGLKSEKSEVFLAIVSSILSTCCALLVFALMRHCIWRIVAHGA